MPVAREPSAAASSSQFSWPSENTVIKIVLVMFLMLHLLAGALLQGSAATGAASSTGEEAKHSLHD